MNTQLTPQQLEALEPELQYASCTYFAAQVLSGPPEFGGRFAVADHHYEWDEIAVNAKRAIVEAPRGIGKSFYWNKAFPIWHACPRGFRGKLIYIFSSNQDRANEFLQIIVDELTSNPKLAQYVPHNWAQRWSKRRIVLANGAEIRARGFGVKVRGGHPHVIILDDVLPDDVMWSETIRKKTKEYFFSAITNMIEPDGQIIDVGTPMHGDDMHAEIRKLNSYTKWKKPAIKDGIPLWAARFSKEWLDAKKEEIGSIRFTREYLVEAVSDDMSIFPSYLFQGEPTQQRAYKLGMPGAFWDALGITRFMGVDIALSAETGADYLVVLTLGVDAEGNRWLCDLQIEKGLGFHAQLDLIHNTAKVLDPALVFIEDNAMQRVWGDELIRTSDLPVKKFTTTAQAKNSLDKGVISLRPLLENKKFRLPVGDANSVAKVKQLIEQMVSFAWVDGKLQGVGTHDDIVMALWIADQAARRGGSAFAAIGEVDSRGNNLSEDPKAKKNGNGKNADVASPAKTPDATKQPAKVDQASLVDPSAEMLWQAMPFYAR